MSNAGTLAVSGDLKEMSSKYLRAAVFERYGSTMFVGIGIPIPIIDEDMMEQVSVQNKDIFTDIIDYSVPRRSKPSLGRVSYQQLRSGMVEIEGRKIRTAPLSSLAKAREIAEVLKGWIEEGKFFLEKPIKQLPTSATPKTLEIIGEEE